jgi:hypothetical protein
MNADDFLLRDYELKVRYLTDHFQRMWTRFNFFVTIESALLGSKFIVPGAELTWQLAILGAALSFIWYVFGSEDRFLVRVYRKQVEDAGQRIANMAWADDPTRPIHRQVGEIEETARELCQQDATKPFLTRLAERVSGWRFALISTTKLAALFPLFVFLVWLGLLTRSVCIRN